MLGNYWHGSIHICLSIPVFKYWLGCDSNKEAVSVEEQGHSPFLPLLSGLIICLH